ncbi:MAG: hypothetical protein Q7T82_13290 [Armatimonadota bacterium]|nr:hypothetical protein [Armatimonadota bacterium]
MNPFQALRAVAQAVQDFTGSSGAPQDKKYLEDLKSTPDPVPWDIFFYVGGIPLSHFFAYSGQAFGSVSSSLWEEIKKASNVDAPEPENWDIDTHLLQISTYILVHAMYDESGGGQ